MRLYSGRAIGAVLIYPQTPNALKIFISEKDEAYVSA